MSQIDSELNALRMRLTSLEAQKRNETKKTLEQKTYPLKTLEEIINTHTNVRRGTSSFQQERYHYAQEKLSFLEPILNALKDIQERLEILEKKE